MIAEYKRDVNHNYLILHGDGEVDTTSYQVRILAGNVVPSLLKCRLQGLDGKVLFYYEITSRQPVSRAFEGKKLCLEDVQLIFNGFVRIMEEMTEHLLNPAQLVLDPDYMYMDAEKKELYFCCLPGYDKGVREQFQTLTEYLLPKLDHEDGRAVMLGYSVYRRAMEDSFHLEYIKEELYRIRDGAGADTPSEMKAAVPQTEADDLWDEDCGSRNGNSWSKEKNYGGKNYNKKNDNEKSGYRYKKEKNSNKREKIGERDGVDRDDRVKSRLIEFIGQYKAYMAGYSMFTVCILALFSANLLGYLPWLQAEWILGGALVCMALCGLLCYFFEKRKKKSETPWRERVRENMQNAQQQTMRGEPVGSGERRQDVPDGFRGEFAGRRDEFTGQRDELAEHRDEFVNYGGTPERRSDGVDRGKERAGGAEDFGETVVLSAKEDTGPASLVSREPGELATIYLEEELTVIGKLAAACDAVIPLPTVSRVHARIRKREDEYFLTDLNSRNGTAVNGRMLKGDEEYLLQDEDEVDIAQARYIFLK